MANSDWMKSFQSKIGNLVITTVVDHSHGFLKLDYFVLVYKRQIINKVKITLIDQCKWPSFRHVLNIDTEIHSIWICRLCKVVSFVLKLFWICKQQKISRSLHYLQALCTVQYYWGVVVNPCGLTASTCHKLALTSF